MADPLDTENGSQASSDERLRDVSFLSRKLNKPELGAISGAVLVFVFFGLTAGGTGMFASDGILNWSTVSAQLGLIAIGACLLMIAGEFDLSIGSMIGFAGIMIAVPTVYWGLACLVINYLCVCRSDVHRFHQRLHCGPNRSAILYRIPRIFVHSPWIDHRPLSVLYQQNDHRRGQRYR